MVRLKVSRWLVPALSLALLPGALAAAGPATSRKSQMEFGVEMARRGLWNEALFRFENAKRLDPSDAAVLNNLAVCYEAAGRFDEALATYRAALAIEPGNRALKANYSRFAEFYQDFKPPAPKPAATAASESPAQEAPEQEAPAAPPAGGGR